MKRNERRRQMARSRTPRYGFGNGLEVKSAAEVDRALGIEDADAKRRREEAEFRAQRKAALQEHERIVQAKKREAKQLREKWGDVIGVGMTDNEPLPVQKWVMP